MFGTSLARSSTCSRSRMRLRTLPASPNTGTANPWLSRKTDRKIMPRKIRMNSVGIWLMAIDPPSTPVGTD
ncbi:hypothetical protein D3C81_2156930 [compost metagenome]